MLLEDASLEFVIDGGGSAIATGEKGFLMLPCHGRVTHYTMLGDQEGSIKVDIWRCPFSLITTLFPPTDDESITNDNEPEISAGLYTAKSSTGWGSGNLMNKYDILAFNVDSCTDITRVTIEISIRKYTTPQRQD